MRAREDTRWRSLRNRHHPTDLHRLVCRGKQVISMQGFASVSEVIACFGKSDLSADLIALNVGANTDAKDRSGRIADKR
jgi:hypothetical protein